MKKIKEKKIKELKPKKNKKKMAIITLIVLIILSIIITCGYFYVQSFKVDREETLKLMAEVNEDYPEFSKSMTEFVNKRNGFYKKQEEIFLEDISKNPSSWTNYMNEYEIVIQKIEDSSKRLKKACVNDFGDITAKAQCNQFRVNYEAAHNYYITDVKVYNELVKKYNEWNNGSYEKLSEVDRKIYKDYIDYDEDGEYFGKEVSK